MKKIAKILLIILGVSLMAACSQDKPYIQDDGNKTETGGPSDPIPSIPVPLKTGK